ncbi:MAG TPA: 3-oxoacyl-[acyl-carrier-protein] synthase III C-terminal domain-containing protein, partial [Mycobacterium sp.]|nr:3-oxoacyl-[acyl-carrier-protein] synthase III C-terminal domain-containing protein [Mycobacterium sp.]
GYDVGAAGFELVLSKDVATIVQQHIGENVTKFLVGHNLTTADIGAWVTHPGGPKVIDAINEALDLPPEALELTWRSLGEIGNLSSASVLHVLRDTLAKPPPSGSPGLMIAMGPGFCSELVLLRWH